MVGQPKFDPSMELDKDVKFEATFEVYPEIKIKKRYQKKPISDSLMMNHLKAEKLTKSLLKLVLTQ